jgi:hypothetical protein
MVDLYRHLGDDNKLLYVGISFNALVRLKSHKHNSSWYDKVKSVVIEKYETRDDALIAEKVAIENEKPLFNVIYNKDVNANDPLLNLKPVTVIKLTNSHKTISCEHPNIQILEKYVPNRNFCHYYFYCSDCLFKSRLLRSDFHGKYFPIDYDCDLLAQKTYVRVCAERYYYSHFRGEMTAEMAILDIDLSGIPP